MQAPLLLKSSLAGIYLTALTGTAFAQKEASSGNPVPFSEGRLIFEITSGSRTETHLYQRKGDQLRITRPGDHIPTPPLNLVDLETGRVTVLFPQNGTARTIETADEQPPASSGPSTSGFPAMPGLPPGIGPNATSGPAPATPARPAPGEETARIGPDPSKLPAVHNGKPFAIPATPAPGDAPAEPGVPLPKAPAPTSNPGMPEMPTSPDRPAMPEMPPMPGGPGAAQAFVLKATAETKELHGYPCTRFTLDLPREGRLALWLTPEEPLFPFHRLRSEGPDSFRPAEWPDQLAALLRSRNLFPLLITRHERERSPRPDEKPAEPGPEITRWEVTSVQNTALKDTDENLFTPADTFHQLRD